MGLAKLKDYTLLLANRKTKFQVKEDQGIIIEGEKRLKKVNSLSKIFIKDSNKEEFILSGILMLDYEKEINLSETPIIIKSKENRALLYNKFELKEGKLPTEKVEVYVIGTINLHFIVDKLKIIDYIKMAYEEWKEKH